MKPETKARRGRTHAGPDPALREVLEAVKAGRLRAVGTISERAARRWIEAGCPGLADPECRALRDGVKQGLRRGRLSERAAVVRWLREKGKAPSGGRLDGTMALLFRPLLIAANDIEEGRHHL